MKRIVILSLILSIAYSLNLFSQGYKIGDKASDFKLLNVNGKYVSLKDYPHAKGFVVIFTCNHCPYAQAYQGRIMQIDKKYKPLGYPVIAISSNDASVVPEDSYKNMIVRAREKGYSFPYLYDKTQAVCREYGAQRTPHVFLLQKDGNGLIVRYIGAIDNNYEDPSKVTEPYLANAINSLLAGKQPNPSFTKAIGCSIKFR